MNAEYAFGPTLTREGATFRLWAPAARSVELLLDRAHPMTCGTNGWFALTVVGVGVGARYRFRIDGELEIPDPVSAFQPEDVFGPSEVVDFSTFQWKTGDWHGRPWAEAVICELHVGAFTSQGTFHAAIEKLDDLADTGFTAIELMPIADFHGRWNWGYDGVLLYAPDHSYGRPEDLMALIDAAHARGLMVFLDVVYNHFGPEGNYLHRIAPLFFTEHHHTPWGAAIDYRVPQVREFAIENALHWLDHYRFDGLRLDAVHAIVEPGAPHILNELNRRVGVLARESGRLIHLVLENDDNRASFLDPAAAVPAGQYRAQWNDDYHHAWHVLLTGESHGYYRDYVDAPRRHLARTLSEGFAYQGEASSHRGGAPRGEDSSDLPPTAFVTFLQNHDQIGNRPHGDRVAAGVALDALRAALAVTLLAPMPVLLFMGEDWASLRPFPFFCDFAGDLGEAVRQGRRREFAEAYGNLAAAVPDPLARATFDAAKLDWEARHLPQSSAWRAMVRTLLAIRQSDIVPYFAHSVERRARAAGNIISARWTGTADRTLHLIANAGADDAMPDMLDPGLRLKGRAIWGGTPPDRLPPWSVYWSIAEG
jgi:maltooligosyltrehalose trehalohydrolase